MSKQSLDAFRRKVLVEWPKQQDVDAKSFLIQTAKAGNELTLRDQTSRAGVAPRVESYANRPGNPVENVTLPGPIVYRYEYLQEVVKVALETLRANSPVRSGRYRDSHTLYLNGTSVKVLPAMLPPGADLFISNPLPYVRKLEIGTTRSGRKFVIQVPDRIYERTAGILRQRYGNVAKITFGFVRVTAGAVADWAQSPSAQRMALDVRGSKVDKRTGRTGNHTGWLTRQPAILIGML